jgi:CheY-like chemotaxis protein
VSRILVVDDEKAVLESLEKALAPLGHPVDRAANGRDAVRLLLAGSYCLVVTDLVMPRRTGLGVIHDLRTQGVTVPVIVCSGYVTPVIEKDLSRHEHVRIIRKPFKPEVLLAMARELVNNRVR